MNKKVAGFILRHDVATSHQSPQTLNDPQLSPGISSVCSGAISTERNGTIYAG